MFDLLLRGGTVIDGSGGPGVRADVGVLGDRVLAVHDLSVVDASGVATVLDVAGRVVAPGFIDSHGHPDGGIEPVIGNWRPAILAGVETGDRPGRLLRRP